MALSGIDYVIVLVYLFGILLLGFFFKKFVHSQEDFFLGGKNFPFWAIGMSLVVTDIGAVDFVGAAGQAYRYGIVVANFDWLGSVPGMILAAFIFIPYYWRAGIYTIPEYLGRRFNIYVRTIEALIWILFLAFNLGIVFRASALLLNAMMGWSIELSIWVTAVVVGIYTVSGGLSAVVMTDVVQLIIMYLGGFVILGLGFYQIGSWSNLVEKITSLGPAYQNHFTMVLPANTTTPYPWTGILFGLTFVLANAYWIGNQTIAQRALGAKDEWNAKAGLLFGAILKTFIPVLVIFPGIIALALFPNIVDGDQAIPIMLKNLLPPGLTGLIFAAFFAGLMSTVDSVLNSAATLFTKDIYEVFIKKNASDRHYLYIGRLVTLILLIMGVFTSPLSAKFPGMYVYVQTLLSIFQGPTLGIVLLGMLWRRTTQWGGLAGLIGGICISVLLFTFKSALFFIQEPFLYISWWSFIGTLIITISISLLTLPEPQEKLYGLVFGLVRHDENLQNILDDRINHQ
ncbi:sodium/solute symporter [candidate division KSB1 bacterium]|nr:sodium/solute symporter [candidate division KSB1 bacterium]